MATSAPPETKETIKTKKKSSKLLILAGILLLAGANVSFWLYRAKPRLPIPVLDSREAAGAASALSPQDGATLDEITLDPFIVNLSGDQGYLKVAMTLSVRKNERSREKLGSMQPDLAHSVLVRDTILEALSSQDADTLLTLEGKAALKKTLTTALEATVPGMAVDRIYFTEFLVQRQEPGVDDLALAQTKGETLAARPAAGHDPHNPHDPWSSVAALPTPIMVAVPLPGFRVRDMLALQPGSLVASAWRGDREVPLSAGHVEFAWAEFEVADEALSARITRLAGE